MGEQIQVREGVWLTREGEEIEVRARDVTGIDTEWRWEGKRRGYYNTWRDDGTIHIEREQKEGDLVRFLRPLPEAEAAPEVQPVQIREGVWRTRGGRQVEVRERSGADSYSFRWAGMLLQINESWRDDGRWSAKNETSHRDLVEYVGPLPRQAAPEPAPEPAPEQQTTTDTLTQIEGQIAAMSDVAEDVGGVELRALAYAAKIDSLQQQLATMTVERDILAQRLWVKPSEEALQKENSRKQIEINTLKDRLGDMTTDRDQSARELLRVTADRDGLLQLRDRLQETLREQRQAIEAARAVQQQLAAMTSDRDRLQARVRDLEIEIDAAGQQPAPADKSEQIERIWDESRERAVSEIIELVIPLQVATGTHAESVLQILPAVIRRWMDGGPDDVE
jgi:hypothetical protein